MRLIPQPEIKDDLSHQAIIEKFSKRNLLSQDESPPKISKKLVCQNINLCVLLGINKKNMVGMWIDSINYLNEIEIKYGKNLSKKLALVNERYKNTKCTKSYELSRLTQITDIEKLKDSVAREYLYVLKFMYRIRQIYSSMIDRGYQNANPFYPEFIDEVFKDKNFEKEIYLSAMTTGFFELAPHCTLLGEICRVPLGVPVSEEIRKERATKAAMARHEKNILYGDFFLYEEVLNLLQKLNDRRIYEKEENIKIFRNIHLFVKSEKHSFQIAINNYKKKLGTSIIEGGPAITFGEDLDLSELVKLMNKWRSRDKFNNLIKNFVNKIDNSRHKKS